MIIGRQINYMRSEELGFSSDAILNIDTDRGDTSGRVKVLAEKLEHLPGINRVARQSFTPITGFHTMLPVQYKGRQSIDISSALQVADQRFIPLYQMKLLAGVNLRHTDGLKEVVINESMVKAMGLTIPREAV